jgi:hypothetical protein
MPIKGNSGLNAVKKTRWRIKIAFFDRNSIKYFSFFFKTDVRFWQLQATNVQ